MNIIQIDEDFENVERISVCVGSLQVYALQLLDSDESHVDISAGTLSVTYINVATGASYAFSGGSAVLTKWYAEQGVLSLLNPSAYPTPGQVRITITWTNGSIVRRFGPLIVSVYSL
jgi:hypothetical protein